MSIEILYSLISKSNNKYYIIILKDNKKSKYVVNTINIEELCSQINILLLNKIKISSIIIKLNLIKTNNTITSIIERPKLNKYKKTYLIPKYSYFPNSRYEFSILIRKLIKIRGNECSLNDIDISKITDMSCLFRSLHFNGDISGWDVGKVTNMNDIFYSSPLEKNPPKWYKGK